jgi:hypothetical protein
MINTYFWDDAFIIDCDPIEKLLFLYFLTNPLTNISGIYEIALKRIAFDTGIDKEMILKILERFTKLNKIHYINGWIIITNFIKNQSSSPHVEAGIIREIDKIPENITQYIHGIDTLYRDTLYIVELSKVKLSNNGVKEKIPPELKELEEYFKEQNIKDFTAEQFFNFYESKGWMIGKNKMVSWHHAVGTWRKNNKDKSQPKKIRSVEEILAEGKKNEYI